jgi:hypothetical protein
MAYLQLIYVIDLHTDASEMAECRSLDAFNQLRHIPLLKLLSLRFPLLNLKFL